MEIKLYQYGVELELDEAVKILRGSLGKKISKLDKDARIGEAIGIIETIRGMIDIYEPEEQATDAGD